MGKDTSIQWTDHTFNPWWGCEKVSKGCANCYAETHANRFFDNLWGQGSERRFLKDRYWDEPWKWNAAAFREGRKELVFCASMADVFEDRPELLPWRRRLWSMIEVTTSIVWQLTTKRPENIVHLVPEKWFDEWPDNVWLLTSVEDQESYEKRRYEMIGLDAPVRGLSIEPLLGPINLQLDHLVPGGHEMIWGDVFDWAIIGGESGHDARPCNALWVLDLVLQCDRVRLPPFVKQLGHHAIVAEASTLLETFPRKTPFSMVNDYDVRLHLADAKGGDPAEWSYLLRRREFPRSWAARDCTTANIFGRPGSAAGDGYASPLQEDDAYLDDAQVEILARQTIGLSFCDWCNKPFPPYRPFSRFCCKRCRQSAFRARVDRLEVQRCQTPLLIAYADPPFPATSRKYYKGRSDYRGEVDHAELVASLVDRYDGWAVSTSASALRLVIPHCPPAARICAWVKPIGVSSKTFGLHNTWEPLIVMPARKLRPGIPDWLRAQPARKGGTLMGRKPLAFCRWLFNVLGMLPDDELHDLFPGTGIVKRAWREVSRTAAKAAKQGGSGVAEGPPDAS